VAVGPGKKDSKRPLMVSVGDHVMYSGTIDRKYEDLILMKDKDVIGLV
jgi:co-chaperonin GroES (HSP10)